jgi:uncharacterized membrane protein YeaQ/YmgE (transglycosylase-associated protein family)
MSVETLDLVGCVILGTLLGYFADFVIAPKLRVLVLLDLVLGIISSVVGGFLFFAFSVSTNLPDYASLGVGFLSAIVALALPRILFRNRYQIAQ